MSENQAHQAQKNQQELHYFLVAGQIEYQESKHNKATKTMLVNGVYASTGAGIVAKDLAQIQVRLQQGFHQKYSRMHPMPPHKITDVVITTCAYLGTHTQEAFMAGVSKDTGEDEPTDKAHEAAEQEEAPVDLSKLVREE